MWNFGVTVMPNYLGLASLEVVVVMLQVAHLFVVVMAVARYHLSEEELVRLELVLPIFFSKQIFYFFKENRNYPIFHES